MQGILNYQTQITKLEEGLFCAYAQLGVYNYLKYSGILENYHGCVNDFPKFFGFIFSADIEENNLK